MSEWTPPRRVYFKRQLVSQWRVTDSDGQRMVPVDKAFAMMQELVEDGWKCEIQESVTGHILSVTMTEPRER